MRGYILLAGLLTVLLAASSAPAETIAAHAATLGWQTEHAQAVVLGDLGEVEAEGATGKREVTFVVREAVRGAVEPGASLTVVFPDHGHGAPWKGGLSHLLFLRRLELPEGMPSRWRTVSGTFGIRAILATGPEARFPGIARQIAATLADTGPEVEKPEELLRLLLEWMRDDDPGVVWSAAMDFVRHEGLRRLLTERDGKLVIDAYRNHPIGKASKEALAMAVAMSGHEGAGDALLESLLLPNSGRIRGGVGDALWQLEDPAVPGKIVGTLEEADPRHRATLVQVLGRVGKKPEAPAVRKLLGDTATDVRIEAAHALGRIARNARKDDPTARVGGRAELYRRVLLSKTKNELRACLWALAQLDDPDAFDLLRRLADKDDRALVRRLAKSYLERPRVSLILK